MNVHSGRDAVSLLSGESYEGDANVVCPNCRSDCTHIQRVGTLVGSDPSEAIAAYEGTAPTGATPSRRSAVEIVFSCEQCPESFALVIQQHKGVNMIQVHQNVGSRTEWSGRSHSPQRLAAKCVAPAPKAAGQVNATVRSKHQWVVASART